MPFPNAAKNLGVPEGSYCFGGIQNRLGFAFPFQPIDFAFIRFFVCPTKNPTDQHSLEKSTSTPLGSGTETRNPLSSRLTSYKWRGNFGKSTIPYTFFITFLNDLLYLHSNIFRSNLRHPRSGVFTYMHEFLRSHLEKYRKNRIVNISYRQVMPL